MNAPLTQGPGPGPENRGCFQFIDRYFTFYRFFQPLFWYVVDIILKQTEKKSYRT